MIKDEQREVISLVVPLCIRIEDQADLAIEKMMPLERRRLESCVAPAQQGTLCCRPSLAFDSRHQCLPERQGESLGHIESIDSIHLKGLLRREIAGKDVEVGDLGNQQMLEALGPEEVLEQSSRIHRKGS